MIFEFTSNRNLNRFSFLSPFFLGLRRQMSATVLRDVGRLIMDAAIEKERTMDHNRLKTV